MYFSEFKADALALLFKLAPTVEGFDIVNTCLREAIESNAPLGDSAQFEGVIRDASTRLTSLKIKLIHL